MKNPSMNNYQTHAMREFRAAGWCDENGKYNDEMQEMICKQVLTLLDVFADAGHSGTSAPYAINLFKSLASFEPIGPLTGEDAEWNEVGPGVYQNNRCSHVFKDVTENEGKPYDTNGRIFREPNGACYTGKGSRVTITFPYTPKREYVDVPGAT